MKACLALLWLAAAAPAASPFRVAVPELPAEALTWLRLGVGEPLVRLGFDFSPPAPCLARAWTHLGGGRWSFRLRKGVRTHDGRLLTAPRAALAVNRFLSSPAGALLRRHLRVRACGRDRLEVTASPPGLFVPGLLARIPLLFPPPPGQPGPIGTGPFRVVRFRPGEEARLRAFEAYWGGAPAIPVLKVRVFRDPFARVAALESGAAEWARLVPRYEAVRLARQGFGVHRARYLYNVYLLFQTRAFPGNDPAVRRAVHLALDRGRLARVAFAGAARPAAGLFPNPTLPPLTPDLRAAVRVLREAGWRGGEHRGWRRGGRRLAFTLLTPSERLRPSWPLAAVLIREDLRRLGIPVRIRVVEKGLWNDLVRAGRFQATLRGRVPAWWGDPLAYLALEFTTGAPRNLTRFRDARLDRLLTAALRGGGAERQRALEEATGILAAALPLLPLVHDWGRELYATAPGVRGAEGEHSRAYGFPGPRTTCEPRGGSP